jgi:hypothetical protein
MYCKISNKSGRCIKTKNKSEHDAHNCMKNANNRCVFRKDYCKLNNSKTRCIKSDYNNNDINNCKLSNKKRCIIKKDYCMLNDARNRCKKTIYEFNDSTNCMLNNNGNCVVRKSKKRSIPKVPVPIVSSSKHSIDSDSLDEFGDWFENFTKNIDIYDKEQAKLEYMTLLLPDTEEKQQMIIENNFNSVIGGSFVLTTIDKQTKLTKTEEINIDSLEVLFEILFEMYYKLYEETGNSEEPYNSLLFYIYDENMVVDRLEDVFKEIYHYMEDIDRSPSIYYMYIKYPENSPDSPILIGGSKYKKSKKNLRKGRKSLRKGRKSLRKGRKSLRKGRKILRK